MKQMVWFKREKDAFGGDRLTRRAERARRRPLSTKDSMHVVLRSTQAVGKWSFRKEPELIKRLIHKYAKKNGVKVHGVANVGNHLHLHIKLTNRFTYDRFIRALTGAIALAITGASKLRKLAKRFWDRRPYSRIVRGRRAYLDLTDYVGINQLEGAGVAREEAEFIVKSSTGRRPSQNETAQKRLRVFRNWTVRPTEWAIRDGTVLA